MVKGAQVAGESECGGRTWVGRRGNDTNDYFQGSPSHHPISSAAGVRGVALARSQTETASRVEQIVNPLGSTAGIPLSPPFQSQSKSHQIPLNPTRLSSFAIRRRAHLKIDVPQPYRLAPEETKPKGNIRAYPTTSDQLRTSFLSAPCPTSIPLRKSPPRSLSSGTRDFPRFSLISRS